MLADRLSRECLLLLHTADDGPADHVRAGQAAVRTALAAIDGPESPVEKGPASRTGEP